MTLPYSSERSFDVPDYLQRSDIGVTSIRLNQRNLIIEYNAGKDFKGQIKILITGKWDTDSYQLKDRAARKGFLHDNIDLLVKAVAHIYSGEAADTIALIKEKLQRAIEADKKPDQLYDSESNNDNNSNNNNKKPRIITHYLQKYHNPYEGNELYEAVLINGEAFFVALDRDSVVNEGQIKCRKEPSFVLPINNNNNTITKILPKENLTYISKPYEFESQAEIDYYLKKASNETLDTLYTKTKGQAKRYIDGTDTHITILSADTIFTYYQDILGQAHYDYFYGDNSAGKTINLLFLSLIAYRAMYDIDITPANIYTYYGSVEEGQGIILEDEADGLEEQAEKMKIYKKGYNSGGKVTRQDPGSNTGRRQDGFYVYGFKAFTGEEKLDPDKAKGFNERTFYIECQEGDPEYDLSEVVRPAGDDKFEALLQELEDLHKLLFAYRLIHHTDKIPNIEVQVKNREKQLTKPLLRLFQNADCQKEIGKALAELLAVRRGIEKDTLEAAIYEVVWELVEQQRAASSKLRLSSSSLSSSVPETYDIPARVIYEGVGERLGGTRQNDRQQSFDTPAHGRVAFQTINRICEDRFGAKKPKRNDGIHLVFDNQRLLKVKAAYDLEQEGIKIIKEQEEIKETSDITNNQNKDREFDSDASDAYDGFTVDKGSTEGNQDGGNRQELGATVENSRQNELETTKPKGEGLDENAPIEGVNTTKPSQPSPVESRRFVGGIEKTDQGFRCPYCELIFEQATHVSDHIKYTDMPNHTTTSR